MNGESNIFSAFIPPNGIRLIPQLKFADINKPKEYKEPAPFDRAKFKDYSRAQLYTAVTGEPWESESIPFEDFKALWEEAND